MKSYKEMANSVFSRIDREKRKERKKRQNRVYGSSLLVIGLVIVVGVGIWLDDWISDGETGLSQWGESQNSEREEAIGAVTESEKPVVDYELLVRIEQAVWAKENHRDGEEFTDDVKSRRKYVDEFDCEGLLYDYLTNAPENIYAILAVPKNADKIESQSIKAQMDEQGIVNFVYKNQTNGQLNYCLLVTAEEFSQIRLENAQDYWFNHALKPTKIEEILFPERYRK